MKKLNKRMYGKPMVVRFAHVTTIGFAPLSPVMRALARKRGWHWI